MKTTIEPKYHTFGKSEPYQGREDRLQIGCVSFLFRQYPKELWLHCPNEGKRSKASGEKLLKMGMKAGVPDLLFPVPRGNFSGLAIELKTKKNVPSTAQKIFLNKLASQGYYCAVVYNFNEFERIVRAWYAAGRKMDKNKLKYD